MALRKAPEERLTFSFSGHETFVLRYGWLTKAALAVVRNPNVFGEDDAIVELGVGKNMVRSMRHWALMAGVLEELPGSRGAALRPTELGRFLLLGDDASESADPYLDDPATLWLVHWNLLVEPIRQTTWSWAFSSPVLEFTKETLAKELCGAAAQAGTKVNEKTVRRDVDVFVRTYVQRRAADEVVSEDSFDCPLAELELLEETDGVYGFRRGPKTTLPDHVFAYAVSHYWETKAPTRETLSFSELCYGPGSPGNAFKLDENSLIDRLENLEAISDGELVYADTSGLKQLYRRNKRNRLEFLRNYYSQSRPTSGLVGV